MGKIITLENLKEYNKKVQEQLAGSLKEPASGLAVGKYFRVVSIDDNGHAILECVDPPTAPVQSISANKTVLTPDENGNVNTPAAGDNVYGLIRQYAQGISGIAYYQGAVYLVGATRAGITARSSQYGTGYGGITPHNLDIAVKAAMTDGIGPAWTAAEQSAAKARMGIVDTVSESYTITTSDWTALSGFSPYTYSATVTAAHTIGNDTTIELINDQPVLFAKYGFAIVSASGQNLTIYSIGTPDASVTLEVEYNG